MTDDVFIEMEHACFTKTGQAACGDDVRLLTIEKEHRSLAALSDGLGSGVKASVLATMTTTMAISFMQKNLDLMQSIEIIMDSLPVCETRKISYATFSLFDYRKGGMGRVVEMGNPAYLHLRGTEEVPPVWEKTIVSKHWPDREVREAELDLRIGDRVVICSDGVTQAGLGSGKDFKFGWRRKGMAAYASGQIASNPGISARDLARRIAAYAKNITPEYCKDDISCLVIYLRAPRVLRILTGPPFYREHDADYAKQALLGDGHVIISGGTTANIIERELGVKVRLDLRAMRSAGGLPPVGTMPGIGIVTEGILTLSRVAKLLEDGEQPSCAPPAARKVAELVAEHDLIEFVVGTKVNESHQDPNIPQDLELRRSVIKRMAAALERNYRKKVVVNYY